MAMDQQAADIAMWLDWSEDWWKKTNNPLYVWRVVAICLNATPRVPIPDWCLPYLATAAGNINNLTSGRDFRGERERVSPDQAHALAVEALGLSSQGKKNAFARVAEDAQDQRHARNAGFGHDAVAAIEKARSVTPEHARRRLQRGKRLARLG